MRVLNSVITGLAASAIGVQASPMALESTFASPSTALLEPIEVCETDVHMNGPFEWNIMTHFTITGRGWDNEKLHVGREHKHPEPGAGLYKELRGCGRVKDWHFMEGEDSSWVAKFRMHAGSNAGCAGIAMKSAGAPEKGHCKGI